jgi:regulator of cell morphogenesis and NO signaling
MKTEDLSLGEIVTAKPQAAALFENYHLDFCCGGKKKLSEVLSNNASLLAEVTEKLDVIFKNENPHVEDFNKVSLTVLIDFIINNHHRYVKENLPVIGEHLQKIMLKHAATYPGIVEAKILFDRLTDDFKQHMMKEEIILFPKIKKLEMAVNTGNFSAEISAINGPVQVMEYEHETAHQLLEEIKKLTDNFTYPENACTTYRVTMEELKIFEKDLHQHVHLENNIVFPKALAMEKKFTAMKQDSINSCDSGSCCIIK